MTKQKKEFIDNLWMNTDYGQWVILSAKGDMDAAREKFTKMQNATFWGAEYFGKELSMKIAENLDNADEFDEYIKMLDEENYDLVDFMIAEDIFGRVYDILD